MSSDEPNAELELMTEIETRAYIKSLMLKQLSDPGAPTS